jgi:SAM-dependent methyltransferase
MIGQNKETGCRDIAQYGSERVSSPEAGIQESLVARQMKQHRLIASIYDTFMWNAERGQLASLRPWIAGEAAGDVLEIGVGTGANLKYYRAARLVVAMDADLCMLAKAESKLDRLESGPMQLTHQQAENLPFSDKAFDSVVCTHVLCSVFDPQAVLREVRRVLRPAGTFRFIEHVRTSGLRGNLQSLCTPLWSRVSGGCHLNRDTESEILLAGFEILKLRRFESWLRLLPCVAGIAVKAPAHGAGG